MPHAVSKITVHPLHHKSSKITIGAEIRNADLNQITDADFDIIEKAFYEHNVILFKGQQALSPQAQFELTRRFDPAASAGYGHDKKLMTEKSVVARDISNIPACPAVQVIGNGPVEEFEGMNNLKLKHPHHKVFHKTSIAEDLDRTHTRFYRWHLDAALYSLNPPRATTLMCVKTPKSDPLTLVYDDDSGDEIQGVPRGSTAFVSSYDMFDLLSEEDKQFAKTTKVVYAAHPYIWMSSAKSRSDGLGMVSEGLELGPEDLPAIDEAKISTLPMCWRNPQTGRLALQVHPSAVQKLITKDGVIDDLEEVRAIVHRLQRPGIAPERVWCVDWEEGDLVVFNNHGTLHTVTGSFLPEEVRIFRQCNLAASEPPLE